MNTTAIELPKYKCHKVVHALKIATLEVDGTNKVTMVFENQTYKSRTIENFGDKIKLPIDDDGLPNYDDAGYYVIYEGGYESWSPSKVFEDGYTLITN